MRETEIENLIQKYDDGQCTPDEIALLETWYAKWNNDKPLNLSDDELRQDLLANRKKTLNAVLGTEKVIKLWPRIVAAASILIFIGIGFYFYQNYDATNPIVNSQHDIAPGGNKAFLTLADGKRITLTDIKNGEIAEQSGVKITKAADDQLIYTVSNLSNENKKNSTYNIIETPRGGTYQVRLPDGTKVWLNAASIIKYPVSFTSSQARRVFLLSGEAYFEVAKDKKHPFIVQTEKQEVQVLGTHFNINNYLDEKSVKTTLLEGSVKVVLNSVAKSSHEIILKPYQQSVLQNNKLNVLTVDVQEAIDWKNGEFIFNNETLESIMRKISRWYNVEVIYGDVRRTKLFSGKISRFENASEVLGMLELTGEVHFKIKERRITVLE